MRLKVSGVGLAAFFAAVSFSLAIAAPAKITRTPDKRPDLNGVWKVLNTANWDMEPHAACAALAFPLQIIQGGTEILIAYEYAGAVRNLVFKDPGPPPVDSWMGQSVAKWEGDTLVVTVTGQSDSTWFDRASNYHSAGMTVVERWTLMGADHIRYEAEITDPETFTRPWKMSMILYRRVGEDARLQQFKCVEFVEELMFGKYRKTPLP